MYLSNKGIFIRYELPKALSERLQYLQSNIADVQQKIISYNFYNDWFLRYGQFLNFNLQLNQPKNDVINMAKALGDSIHYQRTITITQKTDKSDIYRISFKYMADSIEYTNSFIEMQKKLSSIGLVKDEGNSDIVCRGHVINGVIYLNKNTMITDSLFLAEEQIEHHADSTVNKWVTLFKSKIEFK